LDGFSFLNEAAFAFGVSYELRRKNLDGHFAVELEVHSAIDDTHTAAADLGEDLVVRESTSDHGQLLDRVDSMARCCEESS
jgi:hypothetical protein